MKDNFHKNLFPLSCQERGRGEVRGSGEVRGRGEVLQNYYSRIFKTYDLVNSLFTFGRDKKWRLYTVKECLSSRPEKILDLCCGTGDLAITMSHIAHAQVQITGYDLNSQMLEIARNKAFSENVPPVFIQGDAGSMPFPEGEFDCITIGFGFRNLTWENPARDKHIGEISRILKPGGKLFILESARPENKIIGLFYSLYLKAVLVPLGGIVSGDWSAYRYLAGSSAGFYSLARLKEMLGDYKLKITKVKKFMFGSVNLITAIKDGI